MRNYISLLLLFLVVVSLVIAGLLAYQNPALTPFFNPIKNSPNSLASIIGIFLLFILLTAFAVFQSVRRERYERSIMDFLRDRINKVDDPSDAWAYQRDATDVWRTGLMGSDRNLIKQRQQSITGRLIALIYSDARFHRFEPVHLTMRTESSDLSRFSNRISSYQTMAIRLGILGTFIGLIASLGQVQNLFLLRGTQIANPDVTTLSSELSSIKSEISNLMGEVVQGLTLAFGTSIAGIIAAILIVMVASIIRGRERRLANDIQNAVQEVQLFIRRQLGSSEELVQTAKELREVLKGNVIQLENTRKNINHNTEKLSFVAEQFGEGIANPLSEFIRTSSRLDQMLSQSTGAVQGLMTMQESLQTGQQDATSKLEALNTSFLSAAQAQNDALRQSMEANNNTIREAASVLTSGLDLAFGTLGTNLAQSLKNDMSRQIQESVLTDLKAQLEETRKSNEDRSNQLLVASNRSARRAYLFSLLGFGALILALLSSANLLNFGDLFDQLRSFASSSVEALASKEP